jgi:hypothetical protein
MWAAMILYDEGRLGHIGCYGLKSRAEAIAWLERGFSWDRCWFKHPSCWIKSTALLSSQHHGKGD